MKWIDAISSKLIRYGIMTYCIMFSCAINWVASLSICGFLKGMIQGEAYLTYYGFTVIPAFFVLVGSTVLFLKLAAKYMDKVGIK